MRVLALVSFKRVFLFLIFLLERNVSLFHKIVADGSTIHFKVDEYVNTWKFSCESTDALAGEYLSSLYLFVYFISSLAVEHHR